MTLGGKCGIKHNDLNGCDFKIKKGGGTGITVRMNWCSHMKSVDQRFADMLSWYNHETDDKEGVVL